MIRWFRKKLPALLLTAAMIAGMVPAAAAASSDITYKVDAGEKVAFDRTDFREFYEAEYDDTFRYVYFYPDSSYKSGNGVLYYDYDGSGEESFSKSDLEDYAFYYSSKGDGDYPLRDLSFVADKDADGATVTLEFRAYGDDDYLDGVLTIKISGAKSQKGDLTYEVDPGDTVSFDRTDFKDFFEDAYNDTFRYVRFYPDSSYKSANGIVYYDYDGKDEESFSKSELEDYGFYYSGARYGDYPLDELTFLADKDADGVTVTLEFRAYGDDDHVDGVLSIVIGDGGSRKTGDIHYEADPGGTVSFDRTDFREFYEAEHKDTFRYVRFYPDSSYKSGNGVLYYDYEGDDEESFSKSDLEDYAFYYSGARYGDYPLDELTFLADEDAGEATVTLEFRAYGDEDHVDGELTIAIGGTASGKALAGDIRYYTTTGNAVQINQNDIARFYRRTYPGDTLSHVSLDGIPSSGLLYYNYYGVSTHGGGQTILTASNRSAQNFYFSPSGSQYALSELTYRPAGLNYCDRIPFTAYGSNGRSVTGAILIGVTTSAVAEVYGVTPKGTTVTLPASNIYSAVSSATGKALAGIRVLELPSAAEGVLYAGAGATLRADTSTLYGYYTGSRRMEQLRFVPASGFTGSVEIPYVAYDGSGNAFAAGKVLLGVVNGVKTFSDVNSSSWCYRYVTELSDAGVIDGYTDGSFRPDNTVTYGQALKLIMLAAGYPVQAPTGSNAFSGYLAKAQADGLVSGTVNLNASATRLVVAQIAAKAMKLGITGLSSVQPFTDTYDVYVQALNAAGIVEGYFSNGTSAFRPNNTVTRGQIAAIVWRMQQYSA